MSSYATRFRPGSATGFLLECHDCPETHPVPGHSRPVGRDQWLFREKTRAATERQIHDWADCHTQATGHRRIFVTAVGREQWKPVRGPRGGPLRLKRWEQEWGITR